MQPKRLLVRALRNQTASFVAALTNIYRPCCEHPIPAHQARAITLATTTAPSHDNPRDGVAGTFPPHRTCSQSDSWKSPSESDGELCRCFNKYLPSMLRASNSGGLRPCHHIRPHKLGHFPIYSQFHDLQNSNSQTALFKCSVIRMKQSIRNSFHYSGSMLNIFGVRFCDHNIEFSCRPDPKPRTHRSMEES
jgi:hypothetical protein